MSCTDLRQSFGGHLDLFAIIRIGEIDYLQKEVRTADFIQRGPESLDQRMGKITDKTDSVGEQEGNMPGGVDPADRSVQCGKEHVCLKDLLLVLLI